VGAVGIALIAVGVLAGFMGTVRSERSLDSETLARVREKQSKLWMSIIVIGIALGLSYVMRIQGYARLGLTVCVGILVVNAIVARYLKVRLARDVLDAEQMRNYRKYVALEAAGFSLLFVGVYLYLLR
jgi:uncharacterized membrane protein